MKLTNDEEFSLKLAFSLREATTAESASNQAVQYLSQALEDPTYLDRVWNWFGSLREKLGPEFINFLDLVKQKGSSVLQQLGVSEDQISSLSEGVNTSYAYSQDEIDDEDLGYSGPDFSVYFNIGDDGFADSLTIDATDPWYRDAFREMNKFNTTKAIDILKNGTEEEKQFALSKFPGLERFKK